MSANTFFSGDSQEEKLVFDRPVCYLNIFITAGATFAFSLDDDEQFMSLPAGFHSFRIGAVTTIYVQSDDVWQLIGVKA